MDPKAFVPYKQRGLLYQDISLILQCIPTIQLGYNPLKLSIEDTVEVSFPIDYPRRAPFVKSSYEIQSPTLDNWKIYENDTSNSNIPTSQNRLLLLLLEIIKSSPQIRPPVPPKPITHSSVSKTPVIKSPLKAQQHKPKAPLLPGKPETPLPEPKLSNIIPIMNTSAIKPIDSLPAVPDISKLNNLIASSTKIIREIDDLNVNFQQKTIIRPVSNHDLKFQILSSSDTLKLLDNLLNSKSISLNEYVERVRKYSHIKAISMLHLNKHSSI